MSRHWDFRKEFSPTRRSRRRRRGFWRFGWDEIRLVLVVGVTLGLVSQLGSFGRGASEVIAEGDGRVTVVSGPVGIVDGDTFDHRGQRIRIADIDTPEMRSDCAAEVSLARAARDRLSVLLAQGPFELHRIDRDEDQYGRKLRVVVRGGQSIGDRLVAEGLARTWSGRREPWCSAGRLINSL